MPPLCFAQGSRLGSVHLQVALLVKPPVEKAILARSACAGKPRDPPGLRCPSRHGKHPEATLSKGLMLSAVYSSLGH